MNKVSHPKCLLIQHSPLSLRDNNGKSTYKLLKKWDKSEIEQLYVTEQEPDYSLCDCFIQICTTKVMKGFISKSEEQLWKIKTCKEEGEEKNKNAEGKIKRIIKSILHTDFGLYLVNYIWEKKNPISDELIMHMRAYNPEFILLGAGNIKYLLDSSIKLCKMLQIPLFLAVGDDYFTTSNPKKKPLFPYKRKLERTFSNCINFSSGVIAVSQDMIEKLRACYGGRYLRALNSISFSETHRYIDTIRNKRVVYFGNLALDRWKTIKWFAEAIAERDPNVNIHLFTNDYNNNKVISGLKNNRNIFIHKAVYDVELYNEVEDADVFLLVESYNIKHKRLLSTAFSTKIPEYMGWRRPVFAIGPSYSASIRFIKKEACGYVVDKKDKQLLINEFSNMIQDDEERNKLIRKAERIARMEFEENKISDSVEKFILEGIKTDSMVKDKAYLEH